MKNSYASLPQLTPVVVSPTHQRRWELVIQNQEMIGLQKEILHLESKSQKRELTEWEQERLQEVRSVLSANAH